jgi:flagellar biosynthetic protein FlhB
MTDQRTEAPTPRRREEARRKGEGVGRSHELVMAITLGTGVLAMSSLLPGAGGAIGQSMRTAILETGQRGLGPALMLDRLGGGIGQAVGLILPLGLLVMAAGVAANLAAGGLVFSPQSVRFDPKRLNPMTGIRRVVDRQALVRLLISTAKLVLLAVVTWQIVGGRVPALVSLGGASAGAIAGEAMDAIFQLGLIMTILLTVVALVDFIVQRRKATGALKMTKQDVKREARESDGDPQIQAQRRRQARQMAFARMMDAVPTADVVVTNPTHLAVALKYDSLTMGAPRMVAKGQRLMAERIKEIARRNGVPVIEDVPLARALFPRALGSEVPAHLYRAVARLLVIVHQARFDARPGGGMSPRPARGARLGDGRVDRRGAAGADR